MPNVYPDHIYTCTYMLQSNNN